MKKNDIEDLFKKSFEDYEAEVSPGVWKNVRIGLKWGGLALLFNTVLNKIGINTVIALLSSAAIVISSVAIMNKQDNADKTEPVAIETKVLPVAAPQTPVAENIAALNAVEQKEENNKTLAALDLKNTDQAQKAVVAEAAILVESSKKDNKKIASVINKFSEEPVASISASPVSGTAPLIVDLTNSGTGKTNKWTYSDGKKDQTSTNPVHVFETPGIYSVILSSTNAKGETAIDSIKVEVTGNSSVSSIPKDFSPNGDGVLDVFVFQTKNIAKMSAKIFDKKGAIIYKSDTTDAKWNGKDLKGNEAKEGIYFYIINAEGVDGKKYEPKGSINLTR